LGFVSFGELATTGLSTVLMVLAQVWTHWGLNWFFLPNPIIVICLNFQQQIHSQINIFHILALKICEIKSIISDFPRAFQEHQEIPKIPIQFSVSILFNFHWENGSISNSFHTIAPKSLKPSQCTPYSSKLSEDTKRVTWSALTWSAVVREILAWQTKQNKPPCFIDRCTKVLSIKSTSVWYAHHYNTKLEK
jgi:hypothetical protein